MPYIDQNNRKKFDFPIKHLIGNINNEGELNYVITKLAKNYMEKLSEEEKYTFHNRVMGVLVCSMLEFYRIRTAPYESIKQIENGDVDEIRKE